MHTPFGMQITTLKDVVQLHTKSIRGLYTPRLLQNVASTIHMLLTWVFTTTRRGFASFVRQFFTPPTSHIRLSRRQQHGTRSRPPQPAPVGAQVVNNRRNGWKINEMQANV